MQKQLFCLFLVNQIQFFQDMNIFVKAIKPKNYVIERVRLQGLVDHYYCQASHIAHDLI